MFLLTKIYVFSFLIYLYHNYFVNISTISDRLHIYLKKSIETKLDIKIKWSYLQ